MPVELKVELPDLTRGPEGLFGVQHLDAWQDEAAGRMVASSWAAGAGSLAVLADDVLGYAIVSRRPSRGWSVSTEIGIDLVSPVPTDGQILLARASLVHADERGGLAIGEVVDGNGDLVARCRQRGRFIPGSPALPGSGGHEPVPVAAPAGLGERLRFGQDRSSPAELVVEPVLGNPLGNLHGGVTLAASELAACSAVASADLPELTTASIQVSYVRPVPVGTVLRLEAEVVSRGRSLAVVRIIGREAQGKPCTVAHVTLH